MTAKEFTNFLEENKIKTKDAAIITGVSQVAINRYQNGTRSVNRSVVNCLMYYIIVRDSGLLDQGVHI
jgi:hypothetical protein